MKGVWQKLLEVEGGGAARSRGRARRTPAGFGLRWGAAVLADKRESFRTSHTRVSCVSTWAGGATVSESRRVVLGDKPECQDRGE